MRERERERCLARFIAEEMPLGSVFYFALYAGGEQVELSDSSTSVASLPGLFLLGTSAASGTAFTLLS